MLFISGLSMAQSRIVYVEKYNNFLGGGDALLVSDTGDNCVSTNRNDNYNIVYYDRDNNRAWNKIILGTDRYNLVSPISDAAATPRRGWYRFRNDNWFNLTIGSEDAIYQCVGDHGVSYLGVTSTSSHHRYRFRTIQNGLRTYRLAFNIHDDITGELLSERTLNRGHNSEAELVTGETQFDIEKPLPGHRHRFEVTIAGGENPIDETIVGPVNADQNILIKDFSQHWVRFWTTSNITNNDDRINVRAIGIFGGNVRHSAQSNWKNRAPARVLADGYTKEYIYEHPTGRGRGRVENFQTMIVNAQRSTQGEFTRQLAVQGPTPNLRVRLSRNNNGNKKTAQWRLRAEWELHLPPQWDESQILGITTTAFSEEPTTSGGAIYRWVRESADGLTIDRTRYPGRSNDPNQEYRDSNMWRFTDNDWEFTLTFLRREPINGRLERYTIRYHTKASGFQPGANRTTDRHFRYQGGSTTTAGSYYNASSSGWHQPSFPSSLLGDQRGGN